MHLSFRTAALVALPFMGPVGAFWRMECAIVQTGRIDPLVNFGTVAAHVHTISGGRNIGVSSTFSTMNNSSCTSCELSADKSAYWTPLFYYKYPNGTFIEVPHTGDVIYYLGRGPNAKNIIPFPAGLQILSGNKASRSYDNKTMTWGNDTYPGRPVADRVTFECLTANSVLPQTEGLPADPTVCADGLRAQIAFQSCWNGIDLYKADNSHVDYLSQIDNGVCSPKYPFQLPLIFIETLYGPGEVEGVTKGGVWTFSQGDATGYGFHGDFLNGWDMSIQENVVDQCLVGNEDGVIGSCPPLAAIDSTGYPYNCPEQPPEIDEPVHGLLQKLPGCITLTYGPDAASAADMECPASVTQPRIIPTANSLPVPTVSPAPGAAYGLPDQVYLGCYNDSALSIRALNEESYSNYSVMTVEFCQSYCMSLGYRLSGVEFAQECHCDNELNPTSIAGSDQCTWICGGTLNNTVQKEFCGGLQYINIYNNTNATFNAFGSIANTAGLAHPWQPVGPLPANYLGCYTDSGPRTLSGPNVDWNNMTIEICAAFCAQGNGYQYYGVELSSQCFCGNTIGGSLTTNLTNPSNASCDNRCLGSEPEVCGGSSLISVFNATTYVAPSTKQNIGQYVNKGCLTDPNTSGRSLAGATTTSVNITEELCVKYCLGMEYHYAGVEYGSQCYCGNAIVNGGVQEACDPASLMLCAGNSLEYCGGPSLMTLFYSATL